MAAQIPLLSSQVFLDSSSDGVQVSGGSAQTLAKTYWYYLVGPKTSAENGRSLLHALQAALVASHAAGWTCHLDPVSFKLVITNGSGADKSITLEGALALKLGFTSGALGPIVNNGTLTATNKSRWIWTPDQAISTVGPVPFHPSYNYAHKTSRASTAMRASDGKGSVLVHGVQGEAIYTFQGVSPRYKVRADPSYGQEDFEGYWEANFRLGRRVLWWRDRANAVSTAAPGAGSSSPYNCIVYQPQDDLVRNEGIIESTGRSLNNWNIRLPLWTTEEDETPPT